MKKYFCSCSFGKDSIATLLLALEHNEPLDGVVFSEVMFSHEEGISGEDPEHIKWIKEVAIPRLYELGCPEVHILRAKKDYVTLFHTVKRKGKNKGEIYGFPLGGRCHMNSECKVQPIRDFYKRLREEGHEIVQYVGLAIDEPKRLARMKSHLISLLAKYNYTEKMAYELCEKYGLLSPIYQSVSRGGSSVPIKVTRSLPCCVETIPSCGVNSKLLRVVPIWRQKHLSISSTEKPYHKLKPKWTHTIL